SLFKKFNDNRHDLHFFDKQLNKSSILTSQNYDVVCCFVNDQLDHEVIAGLKRNGIKLIALRSAGFDHVDIKAAKQLNLPVVRVPSYSPNAIAEFTIGMILALVRKIPRAHDLVRRHNFSLEGQLGFNLQGKTIGIVGTGKIGAITAKILKSFDCKVLAFDPFPNDICRNLGITYTTKEELFQTSDIISLHCPLNSESFHIINDKNLALMKKDVVLINTGRGALIDTTAIIQALKSGKIGGLGIDVYENEHELFFEDRSNEVILDDQFIRLQAFPNVIITGHQAYLTSEALENIVKTTLDNISNFEKGIYVNQVY
ncbi:MAG: D-isomer specific 2-hydroxyacid dehydrogenase NAD-binding protein, partial [Gammaproteobacteria bacterium]|nr:D-isomer specific 2-hydroxyacid dehydrogenase NAD-binding protein [Gammaproteobacteria bacterium]